ncbi:ABC transporter ATP-binding protein [bacterium]|nr:ABC transporter ATP-binding protein [bacterium]
MSKAPPLVVDVQDLTIRFGSFVAVNRISFSVKQGEIFGFLGANGAGKTTTIRMLCGLLIPNEGEAYISGISIHQDVQAIKTKVGYMSQHFTLYNDLTVAENLAFAADLRKLEETALEKRKKELFQFVDFTYPEKILVKNLPGGVKQQISLATAILHDPDIIFLDEPTAGVAPLVRAKFWKLINKLARAGKTVFVTTHYLDEAEQCDRIALMRDGEIIALDTPKKLKQKTFPEPLLEIEPPLGASRSWMDKLKVDPKIAVIQAYGRRYHVLVKNGKEWKKISRKLPRDYLLRKIQPSLEDVFIRQVEGDPA